MDRYLKNLKVFLRKFEVFFPPVCLFWPVRLLFFDCFPTSRHYQSDRYFSFRRRFDEASMRLQDGAKGFRRFVFRLRLRSLLAAKLPRLPR